VVVGKESERRTKRVSTCTLLAGDFTFYQAKKQNIFRRYDQRNILSVLGYGKISNRFTFP
jgi:hypothetical protein